MKMLGDIRDQTVSCFNHLFSNGKRSLLFTQSDFKTLFVLAGEQQHFVRKGGLISRTEDYRSQAWML